MNQHSKQIGHVKTDKNNNELNLTAFGGTCCVCCKKGHQSKDCKSKEKKGGNSKFKGSNNYGKIGHKEVDWDEADNKNNKPTWYKPKSEVGATVADKAKNDGGSLVEFLKFGMEFPQQAKLLQDPNVWIADTGAAVY